jgi:hypothetical protein
MLWERVREKVSGVWLLKGTAVPASRLKLDRNRLQFGERFHSFLAKFTIPARLPKTSPRQVRIENIRAVHPHGAPVRCVTIARSAMCCPKKLV